MSDTTSFIKFTKVRDIGNQEGKNSDVFLAKDNQLDCELVIKRIKKEKFNPEEYFSEAKMIYENKHPHIVEIQYASQDDEYIYMAMPYYKNGSLNSLAHKRFLSVRETIKYSLELLSAVNCIHSKGLIHLDIKPTNILLDETGKALLTDFGLSRYLDENGMAEQNINYTIHSDPEYLQNSGRSIQSDIYQIGLTMYRLCNGVDILSQQLAELKIQTREDFEDSVLNGRFPKRDYYLPHIPKKIRKIINKALMINPEERYKNIVEMMNDLSVVDDNLDWIFTGNLSNPYVKVDNNYRYSVIITSKKDIECYKEKLDTGKKTKIGKYCIKHGEIMSLDKELQSIVGGIN